MEGPGLVPRGAQLIRGSTERAGRLFFGGCFVFWFKETCGNLVQQPSGPVP